MNRAFTCRAVLFDLDGTLIDSRDRIIRLWKWWAARRGLDFEPLLDVIHGRPAVESIRLVAPQLNSEDEVAELETEEIRDMHDVRLIPGALELLASLTGAPWAIVTSGSTRAAEARIRHVGLPRPPVLITADQIKKGKPAPDAYLLGAAQLGSSPADCIVVEDAPVGVAAAAAAGMRVVAVASTNPPESLRGADAVINRLSDLHVEVDATGLVLQIPG